jgi:hypothetical protein
MRGIHLKVVIGVCIVVTHLSIFSTVFAKSGGAIDGGGGEGVAAHYASVVKRSFEAIKIICKGSELTNTQTQACNYLAPYELAIQALKILPRTRDSILGVDGKARDAGNDGNQSVFLDIDRWSDKLNQLDINKISDLRAAQIRIAIHEPLVLAGAEVNDNYTVSNVFMDLLVKNNFDFNKIVGAPLIVTSPKNEVLKFFEGEASVDNNGSLGCSNEATAKASRKAQEESFLICNVERSWTHQAYWSGSTTCHIQLKCNKAHEL